MSSICSKYLCDTFIAKKPTGRISQTLTVALQEQIFLFFLMPFTTIWTAFSTVRLQYTRTARQTSRPYEAMTPTLQPASQPAFQKCYGKSIRKTPRFSFRTSRLASWNEPEYCSTCHAKISKRVCCLFATGTTDLREYLVHDIWKHIFVRLPIDGTSKTIGCTYCYSGLAIICELFRRLTLPVWR